MSCLHPPTSLDLISSKMDFWIIIWIVLYQSLKGSCQQQYFRVQPKDVQVQEGGEATLQCEITHLAGQVQWTKDGFALGFSPEIPGFPRYKMIGDFKNGVYNLNIVNASLEDDAQFQCQVGPSGVHKPIRANANLSVISPPSSIDMVGHPPNSKIEIKENQEFQLECLVKNSKPAAKIVWFRGTTELKIEKREDKVIIVDPSKKAKRYDVTSRIRLQPSAEDDFADYTCEARHQALSPEMPMRATVQLSVLYPPGLPYIEGYTEGETIRRGQNVELVCRSRGGNPPAQLIWYKNGEQIRMAYRTSGRLSENIYSFTAEANDNKAKYRCEASNIMSTSPLKAEVDLTVLFAPTHVTISGPTEARVGDTVPMTCTTASSNPPADIKWMINGKPVKNSTQRTIAAPEGGWFTTSNTTALIGPGQKSLVVICHGLNKQLTENIVSTHTINVLYPPGQPMLTGYTKGTHIAVGTLQKISCISSGGNPLATLTWYKNDKKINSVSKINERSVSAEVTILTNVTDNEAVYKCEASNPATEIPLIERVQLSVHFPPEHVKIKKEPEELRAGSIATLTCDASSSNPPSEMSWWRDGISVTEGISNTTNKAGLHGGTVSSIQLKLNITPEIDGDVYTCQAANTVLQRSVHDAVTMTVLYKPIFNEVGETELSGVEGESLMMGVQAVGHPPAITYTWTKDRAPLSPNKDIHIEGPYINFTRLHRTFTGIYTCEAVNSEGATTITFNLTVFYGGSIVATSHGVSVSPKEDAELWCKFDGSPLSPEHITWKRDDFPDMSQRTTTTWNNNTSFLTIHEAQKEDIGHFTCSINNGYGNETSKNVFLIVKHKPEMDLSPNLVKFASNDGETGKLVCRVSAAPAVNFTWMRDKNVINTDHHKYLVDYKQIDDIHYESIVLIRNIDQSDYGRYECIARNYLGFSTNTVILALTNSPDPPSNFQVYNVSHDSLTLGWEPGFDGGLPASYRLRYRQTNVPGATYKYEDTGNVTRYTVTGLELGTEYVFSIQALNRLGSSRYLADTLKVTTSSVAPPSLPSRGGGTTRAASGFILILGFILGVVILLLNLLLLGCCLRRRKARLAAAKRVTEPAESVFDAADIPLIIIMAVVSTAATLLIINILVIAFFYYRKRRHGDKVQHEGSSDHGSNKNPPMEMYAPSSYNETVTGETLSSVSEKSESYSDQQDYNDDTRKPAASTYLIDHQNDYPFQYPGYDLQPQIKDMEPVALHRQPYPNQNGGLGVPQVVDNYYTVSPDPRYVAYPPPLQFAQPPLPASTRQVPPDVTVLSAPPLLSTFNYSPASHLVEPDSHLV